MNSAVPWLCAPSNVLCNAKKCPPPNPYISEMAISCRFQKVYTYPPPPPQVTTCLHMEAKLVENAEKCQNPRSWHIMNVPERYTAEASLFTTIRTTLVVLLGPHCPRPTASGQFQLNFVQMESQFGKIAFVDRCGNIRVQM